MTMAHPTINLPTEILYLILSLGSNSEAAKNRLVCRLWNTLISCLFDKRTLREIPRAHVWIESPWEITIRKPTIPAFAELDLTVSFKKNEKSDRFEPNYQELLDIFPQFQKFKQVRSMKLWECYFQKDSLSADLIDRLLTIPRILNVKHIEITDVWKKACYDLDLSIYYRMIVENPRLESFVMTGESVYARSHFEKFHKACLAHANIRTFDLSSIQRPLRDLYAQIIIMLTEHSARSLVYRFKLSRKEKQELGRRLAFSPRMCVVRMRRPLAYFVLVFHNARDEPMVFFIDSSRSDVATLSISKIEEAMEFHDGIVSEWTRHALAELVGTSVAYRIDIKVIKCVRFAFTLQLSCANPLWAAACVSNEVIDRVTRSVCLRFNNSLHAVFSVQITKTWMDGVPNSPEIDEEPQVVEKFQGLGIHTPFSKFFYTDRELYAKELK